ncbi:protein pxr1-like [Limosa lapponica baueri]|uniref:Protein pxr1-like n=1 Tax=Limosa lapponica baueri TaxID=1758121 RepID=A0A2I0TJK1_LIMLA|nr:protein pxr1-like [Limosa lapponica baueri]
MCESNNSAETKVSEEGRGGGDPGSIAEIALQPMVKTMVRQAVPWQPMEVHGGADTHLQPMEAHGAGGCLKESVTPVGSLSWSKLLAGPVAP